MAHTIVFFIAASVLVASLKVLGVFSRTSLYRVTNIGFRAKISRTAKLAKPWGYRRLPVIRLLSSIAANWKGVRKVETLRLRSVSREAWPVQGTPDCFSNHFCNLWNRLRRFIQGNSHQLSCELCAQAIRCEFNSPCTIRINEYSGA